jgi:hypothetical protein
LPQGTKISVENVEPNEMSDYPATPELDKLSEARDDCETIGNFLEWLESEAELGPEHTLGATRLALWDGTAGRWLPLALTTEEILARYCNIDLAKVAAERAAVLQHVQQESSGG